MGLVRLDGPAQEPVSIEEARAQLSYERNEPHEADDLLNAQIAAAREWCETFTRRSFIETAWAYTLDGFPTLIRPPRSALLGVDEIRYIDHGGTEQVVDPGSYQVDTASEPGRIIPAFGKPWPMTAPVMNAVTIKFRAGFGADAEAVPPPIKAAILKLVADLYEIRVGSIPGTIVTSVPIGIERLLLPYVVDWF